MQDTMHVLHRLCGQRSRFINRFSVLLDDFTGLVSFGHFLSAGQQRIKILLYRVGIQFSQLHRRKIGLNVEPYIVPVNLHCAGLYPLKVCISPDVQPLTQRHFTRFPVCFVVHRRHSLCQLLPDFLLGLAVNGLSDRLSCAGIMPHDKAGFPCAVCPLPDASGSLRRSGI